MLSAQDNIESISAINKAVYKNYYTETHHPSIQLIRDLQAIIQLGDLFLPQIANITHQLQLNDLFASKLPKMLRMIYTRNADPSILAILRAMTCFGIIGIQATAKYHQSVHRHINSRISCINSLFHPIRCYTH